MPSSKDITFEDLAKYFHLPINQVAKELGICATILKKICRKNGIPRWPHRKIKSIDKRLIYLQENLKKDPTLAPDAETEMGHLKRKKNEIMNNPAVLMKNPSSLYSLKPIQTTISKLPVSSSISSKTLEKQLNAQEKQHSSISNLHLIQPSFNNHETPSKLTNSQTVFPQSIKHTLNSSNNEGFDLILRASSFQSNNSLPSIISSKKASRSSELPSFKFLFDVIEGERALLVAQEKNPPLPSNTLLPPLNSSLSFPRITSSPSLSRELKSDLHSPSPFPDWYFEEKTRVFNSQTF